MKIFDQILFEGGTKLAALGDAIIVNSIVHRYAKDAEKLYLPARTSNLDTIKCLYQDHPNIEIVPYVVKEDVDVFLKGKTYTKIGAPDIEFTDIYLPYISEAIPVPVNWDRQLYEFYDLPISAKYKGFQLPKHIEGSDELYQRLTQGDDNYCLVHQQTFHHSKIDLRLYEWRAQYNLPQLKIIEITPDITSNMLQYIKLIENAREIHCVPSSFFCLVDSVFDRTSANLFYHNIRATTFMQVNSKWNNNKWNIVNYARKL
jgi:hypothetical protein